MMSPESSLQFTKLGLIFTKLFRKLFSKRNDITEKEQQSRKLQLVSAIVMDEASASQWATSNEAPASVQVHLRSIDRALT